jgi:ABC-type nickel/cobalt efflux system permease component RcnA
MEYHEGPFQKMSPSGFIGLLVVIFVIFASSTLFAPTEFALLFACIALIAIPLAFFLHRRFLRQARHDEISLLSKPEETFVRANRMTSSRFDKLTINKVLNAACPYCKNHFQPNEHVMFCEKCNAMHHLDCWNANSGCGIFGCESKKAGNLEQFMRN